MLATNRVVDPKEHRGVLERAGNDVTVVARRAFYCVPRLMEGLRYFIMMLLETVKLGCASCAISGARMCYAFMGLCFAVAAIEIPPPPPAVGDART